MIAGPTALSRKAALKASDRKAAIRLVERVLVVMVITWSFSLGLELTAPVGGLTRLSQGPCQFRNSAEICAIPQMARKKPIMAPPTVGDFHQELELKLVRVP